MTNMDCKPRDEESKTVASSLADDRDFVRALVQVTLNTMMEADGDV